MRRPPPAVAERYDRGELPEAEVEPEMEAAAERANVASHHRKLGQEAATILASAGPHRYSLWPSLPPAGHRAASPDHGAIEAEIVQHPIVQIPQESPVASTTARCDEAFTPGPQHASQNGVKPGTPPTHHRI